MILLAIQTLVLLPFVLGKTPLFTYLAYATGSSGGRVRGAAYGNSIFWNWQMVSKEVYESDVFLSMMRFGIVGVNVFFFFTRMQALPRCIANVLTTFDKDYAPRCKGNVTWLD